MCRRRPGAVQGGGSRWSARRCVPGAGPGGAPIDVTASTVGTKFCLSGYTVPQPRRSSVAYLSASSTRRADPPSSCSTCARHGHPSGSAEGASGRGRRVALSVAAFAYALGQDTYNAIQAADTNVGLARSTAVAPSLCGWLRSTRRHTTLHRRQDPCLLDRHPQRLGGGWVRPDRGPAEHHMARSDQKFALHSNDTNLCSF